MTHLRYSKTTQRERESKRSKKEEGDRCVCECVCAFPSASLCVCVRVAVFACVCSHTHHLKMVQMSMLWLVPHTVQHASKRRDFPSLFQISQAVQMGTDMLPK